MTLRIAHISDLHLLSLEGVGASRFLNKRFSGWVNLRVKRRSIHRPGYLRAIAREIRARAVDHVVVTGDLTNLALEPEFEAVRRLLLEEVGLGPEGISVVPGNHDLYTRGALTSRRFSTYFGEFTGSDLPDVGVDVSGGTFPFVRLRGNVAVIGLSSAVPRPPLVAAGALGARQLDRLARLLEHPEVAKRTPVVLLHHPAENPESRTKTLVEGLHDATELRRVLGKLERGLVLHGHLHERMHRKLPTERGQLELVGATSASLHHESSARMAGFNLYEFDDDGAIARLSAQVYEPDSGRFHHDEIPRHV